MYEIIETHQNWHRDDLVRVKPSVLIVLLDSNDFATRRSLINHTRIMLQHH